MGEEDSLLGVGAWRPLRTWSRSIGPLVDRAGSSRGCERRNRSILRPLGLVEGNGIAPGIPDALAVSCEESDFAVEWEGSRVGGGGGVGTPDGKDVDWSSSREGVIV